MRSAVARALSGSRSVAKTRAPAVAMISAIAAPIPDPAPVTSAIFPARLNKLGLTPRVLTAAGGRASDMPRSYVQPRLLLDGLVGADAPTRRVHGGLRLQKRAASELPLLRREIHESESSATTRAGGYEVPPGLSRRWLLRAS